MFGQRSCYAGQDIQGLQGRWRQDCGFEYFNVRLDSRSSSEPVFYNRSLCSTDTFSQDNFTHKVELYVRRMLKSTNESKMTMYQRSYRRHVTFNPGLSLAQSGPRYLLARQHLHVRALEKAIPHVHLWSRSFSSTSAAGVWVLMM